ncbi:hypothetical protein BjapCC829_06440 [Bradyrhizobium barranii]|uniref:Uncharacterized protein n=1 Tax=Bradyrhizobium barranii TaxID=2992140 RepID=A0ABY3QT52_9BRAD|nr:hypothetical protein [Bradyrhizobium japonicum]UFW88227.1 hypothetical protein BjapCC829_06440 [Bradyrhizobium japonicum]
MRIDFRLAADTAPSDLALKDRQVDPQTQGTEPTAANDNDVTWPFIPFPEDWYASV